jgi:hypothetical protein
MRTLTRAHCTLRHTRHADARPRARYARSQPWCASQAAASLAAVDVESGWSRPLARFVSRASLASATVPPRADVDDADDGSERGDAHVQPLRDALDAGAAAEASTPPPARSRSARAAAPLPRHALRRPEAEAPSPAATLRRSVSPTPAPDETTSSGVRCSLTYFRISRHFSACATRR